VLAAAVVGRVGGPVSGGGSLPGDSDADVDAEQPGQQGRGEFGGEGEQRGRACRAGAEAELAQALGLAVGADRPAGLPAGEQPAGATQTWPAVFGPALLLALPSWRRRTQFAAAAAGIWALLFATMPLTVGTPVAKLPYIAKQLVETHPSIGTWGWSGVWVTVHPTKLPVWQDPLWLNAGSTGTKAAIAGALLAVWWWRRAHPLDVATATTTALVVITPSFGNQYLLWQAPSATARPTRLSIPLQIVLGAYAAIFYLPMQMLTWHNWEVVNDVMMFVSLGVIAFMIAALPWRRRQWQPPQPQQHGAEHASDAAAA